MEGGFVGKEDVLSSNAVFIRHFDAKYVTNYIVEPRKGSKMKTFLKIATAVSALAITSAAYADSSTTVNIQGNAPAFCNIASATPTVIAGTTASAPTYSGGSVTFDYGNNLVDANGKGVALAGSVDYHISANGACAFSLSSAHGGLQNNTGQTGTVSNGGLIQYGASLNSPVDHLQATPIVGSSNPTVFGHIADGSTPNPNIVVTLAYGAAPTSYVLAAGAFSDTLTIGITATP